MSKKKFPEFAALRLTVGELQLLQHMAGGERRTISGMLREALYEAAQRRGLAVSEPKTEERHDADR
ncbi:MAG: hypothetical protein AB1453_04435 [Chloroflexota bacterium]